MPRVVGDHGARLLPCAESLGDSSEIWPLFIRDGAKGNYMYYGSYKEPSSANSLSLDEMSFAPPQARYYWAQQLGSSPKHESKQVWKLETLKKMWPKKSAGYRWDVETKTVVPDSDLLVRDPNDMYLIRRPITDAEAEKITTNMIMKALDAAEVNTNNTPVVRLFHGYLECIGYDAELYNLLRTTARTLEATKVPRRS